MSEDDQELEDDAQESQSSSDPLNQEEMQEIHEKSDEIAEKIQVLI